MPTGNTVWNPVVGINHSDPIKQPSNIKLPRWHCYKWDAKIVGKAVVDRELDETLASYQKFLDNNPELAHKFGYQYDRGRRNLRMNVLKTIQQVNWF